MKIVEIVYTNNDLFKKYEYSFVVEQLLPLIKTNMQVLVETDHGERVGTIHQVLDLLEENLPVITATVIKKVSPKELKQAENNKLESEQALIFAQRQANQLNLSMRFVDSFYTFDKKQLYLTYTADMRIDFRELAKILAQKYKTRIELRQIGVRDKAKKIGGLGPCGLFLCCNTFLNDFVSVSINMAKNQFLALNPAKINGLCGRLLCCLNYEDETYTELKKDMPVIGTLVNTKNGSGKIVSVDILKRTYKVELQNREIIELEV